MQIKRKITGLFALKFSSRSTPIFLNYYSVEWFKYGVMESKFLSSHNMKDNYITILQEGKLKFKPELINDLQSFLVTIDEMKIYKNIPLLELKEKDYQPINQYEKVVESIKLQLNEIQTRDPSNRVENLQNLTKLMLDLNIMNPAIWAQLFEIIYQNIDQLVMDLYNNINESLFQILHSVNKQFQAFGQENWGVYHRKLIIKEKELTSIIKSDYILVLCHSINKQCEGDFSRYKVESLFKVLYEIFIMCNQYKRVSYLQINKLQQMFQSPLTVIIKNAENIDPKYYLNLYEILVELSLFDADLMKLLNQSLINYAQVLFPENVIVTELSGKQQMFIKQLLNCWKFHGQYDKNIYQIIKSYLFIYIRKQGTQVIISTAYNMITAQLDDIESIQELVTQLSRVDYQNLQGNERNLIHIFFRMVQLKYPEIKLQNCLKLIQHLNGYCVAHQQELKPRSNTSEQYPTCIIKDKKPIEILKNYKSRNQYYEKPEVEKIIVNQILEYFSDTVCKDEQLSFKTDHNYCLFEIDLALFIGNQEKVAIEICGAFYGFQQGGLIGKKNNKFQLLQNDGWKLILVKTQDIQQKLAFQCGQNLKKIAEDVLCQIENQIGRKLGRNIKVNNGNVFTRRKIQ